MGTFPTVDVGVAFFTLLLSCSQTCQYLVMVISEKSDQTYIM
jgi:hypothetical protein